MIMNCVICHSGITTRGDVTVTLQKGETTIVVKNVPAQVCSNCGEYYLDDDVASKVNEIALSAVKKGTEVEIVRYAA
jgi:YgiT-type zinc finger domain-containing protein